MRKGAGLLAAALLGASVAVVVLEVFRDDFAIGRVGATDRGTVRTPTSTSTRTTPAEVGLRGLDLTAEEESWVRKQVEHERARREEARIRPTDTGLRIIERILNSQADPSDLLADFDLFASHVESAPGSAVVIRARGEVTLDVRGGTAAVFENVRFRAWWTSAGYSAPIGFSGRGYLGFRNCEWIGGYRATSRSRSRTRRTTSSSETPCSASPRRSSPRRTTRC